MLAAALVAVGMHGLIGWGWLSSAMFGSLIAATDPVSVIAALKELKVDRGLRLLVEAESLLNDGTAAVGFAVLIAIAGAAAVDPSTIVGLLLWKVFGGILVGSVLAGGLLLLAGRTDDHLGEITLTTIAAYGAFLTAQRLETSGVLAALTAGMVVGNIGWRGYISQSGRGHVLAFWEYAAFLANSVIFILIGLHEAHEAAGLLTSTAPLAIVLVLLGRAVAVYSLCPLFNRSLLAVERSYQHVLVWGGLRGALALVFALTLPPSIVERREMAIATFAVVAFSICPGADDATTNPASSAHPARSEIDLACGLAPGPKISGSGTDHCQNDKPLQRRSYASGNLRNALQCRSTLRCATTASAGARSSRPWPLIISRSANPPIGPQSLSR